ncbi:Uncharacterized protein GBIM_18100 [Gryllus bimaculatus]|nr:Uncharacterized protein GBIM_18100 [Gryllus bimaculatus]
MNHSRRNARCARYHAASAALLAREPAAAAAARALGNPMRPGGPATFGPFVEASLRLAAGACRAWPGFREYADCLDALRPGALEAFAAHLDPAPGRFSVVAHGDFWLNNMLFRYERGRPVDMRMVDFQISCVASPAIDLLYFLSTSPSEDVSSRHEALLLREYHVALRDAMELLGLQVITRSIPTAECQTSNSVGMISVSLKIAIGHRLVAAFAVRRTPCHAPRPVSQRDREEWTLWIRCAVGIPFQVLPHCRCECTRALERQQARLRKRPQKSIAQFGNFVAPPLEALQAALDAHGAFALFGATGVLPLVKVDAAPDVNATAGGAAAPDAGAFMYEDPAVKAWLQRVLPEYKRRGWLRL